MKNVLICNPSFDTKASWLPYLWGLLKTYAEVDYEHSDVIREHYNWLKPVFHRVPVWKMLEMYPETPIDVLGISCYMWNWDLNLEIARAVKEINPQCLIVAGGPQLSWQHPDDHGVIDIIVAKEGERAFADILYQHATSDDPRWEEQCTNVIVPSKGIRTPISKLPIETLTSPFAYLKDDFLFHADNIRKWKRQVSTSFESNRGCPFQCTFCDWGSDIYTPVRKFDYDRVMGDIDVIGQCRAEFIFVSDANYGMLPRDVEFSQAMVDSRHRYGKPGTVFFNSTKNKKKYVNQINALFIDAELIHTNQVSFQHTRKPVLEAIKRGNISVEQMYGEMKESWEIGIPVVPVLISANPGDTPELWRGCLDDVLSWGFHEDIRIHDFALLPNAPAAADDYMAEWEIDVVRRKYADVTPSKKKGKYEDENKTDFIVSTKTFSRDEWKEMKWWSEMIQGIHVTPVLRFVAMYMYYYEGMSYTDFYNYITHHHSMLLELRRDVDDMLQRYLDDPEQDLFMDADPDISIYVQPANYLYVMILKRLHEFFEEVYELVWPIGASSKELFRDLVNFNRDILITPDYDPDVGRDVYFEYNWRQIFSTFARTCPGEFVPPRLRIIRETAKITQDRCGMYGFRSLRSYEKGNVGSFFNHIVGPVNLRHSTTHFKEFMDEWEGTDPLRIQVAR